MSTRRFFLGIILPAVVGWLALAAVAFIPSNLSTESRIYMGCGAMLGVTSVATYALNRILKVREQR